MSPTPRLTQIKQIWVHRYQRRKNKHTNSWRIRAQSSAPDTLMSPPHSSRKYWRKQLNCITGTGTIFVLRSSCEQNGALPEIWWLCDTHESTGATSLHKFEAFNSAKVLETLVYFQRLFQNNPEEKLDVPRSWTCWYCFTIPLYVYHYYLFNMTSFSRRNKKQPIQEIRNDTLKPPGWVSVSGRPVCPHRCPTDGENPQNTRLFFPLRAQQNLLMT